MKLIRKLTACILFLGVCLTSLPAIPPAVADGGVLQSEGETRYALGDVDLSGEVAASDLTALARLVGGVGDLPEKGTTYGYGEQTSVTDMDVKDTNGDGIIKVACVGDSITQGLGNTPYPNRLGTLLGSGYNVGNFGLWGTTACNNTGRPYTTTADSPYQNSLDFAPEVVIIMLGTNDGGSDVTVAQADLKTDLTSLIRSYENLDSNPLVVLATSPTAYIDGNKNVNTVIAPLQRELAEELDIPMVDMHALTANMSEQFQDGLHPSESGYFYVALRFYEQIFGGAVSKVTVNTEPGATVKINAYETKADAIGTATFPAPAGNQTLSVQKDGFETANAAVTIPETASCSITCGLKPTANLALSATAFDNGCAIYEGTKVAANINDGDLVSGGWQPASWTEGDYVGLTFAQTEEVYQMTLYWETAGYISSYNDGGYEVWVNQGGTWTKTDALTSNRLPYGTADGVADAVIFNNPVEMDGIRIVLKNGTITDHKYAPKLYEMTVYGANTGEPDVDVREGDSEDAMKAFPLGDLDLDGEVRSADLTLLARLVAGIASLGHPEAYSLKDQETLTDYESMTDAQLARRAAADGMVLLKNDDNCLPFKNDTTVSLFAKAQVKYQVGGTGSGSVNTEYTVNLLDGMETKVSEGKVTLFRELADNYHANSEYSPADDVYQRAVAASDKAVMVISRVAGERSDRTEGEGDYKLSTYERGMLDKLTAVGFTDICVVLNIPGIMDMSWLKDYPAVKAVLLAWQGGSEGGNAMADVLCGDVNPSGKLNDTIASSYDLYPSSVNFNQIQEYTEYIEDIYVGYRYFDTFDPDYENVDFCFGHGLSYTDFAIDSVNVSCDGETVTVTADVTNTGGMAGREVVQVYFSAPQGKLGKPSKELAAFAKTRLLAAGETETVTMTFPLSDLSSYDDTGLVQKSAYVLEAGEYRFYVGNSVRNAGELGVRGTYTVDTDTVTEQLTEQLKPTGLSKRLRADGTYETLTVTETPERVHTPVTVEEPDPRTVFSLVEVYRDPSKLEAFVNGLTVDELIWLMEGHAGSVHGATGSIGTLPEIGIVNAETADGPAGLRLTSRQMAWPIGSQLACTFDTDLLYSVGTHIATAMEKEGVDIWLAPGMNIHRNPLCGRNFEYYSEDPLVTGLCAAAITQGVQSKGGLVTVKHFAMNNAERYRGRNDSRASERAIREIYLKGFEICIKKANPGCIMTAYNKINGYHSSENVDLIQGILRGEWGYEGLTMSDWHNAANKVEEVLAGNNVSMPEGYPDQLKEAYLAGTLPLSVLRENATYVLKMVLKTTHMRKTAGEAPFEVPADGSLLTVKAVDYAVKSDKIGQEACTLPGVPFNTTETKSNTFLGYYVDVEKAGEYQFAFTMSSPTGSGSFVLYVDGENQGTVQAPVTDGWQNWERHEHTATVSLAEGVHSVRLAFLGGNINLATWDMSLAE